MGLLRWFKELIFGKPKPEPIPEPDIIEKTVGEIWRAVTGEAREEWREEPRINREEAIDRSCDILAETKSMEEAMAENPYEVSDENIWRRYDEMKEGLL